jgi:hypothetical protein
LSFYVDLTMATDGHKPRKHVTFEPDVLQRLEHEAAQAKVGLSAVIEGHIKADWQHAEREQTVLHLRMDQLSADLTDLRAKVLPLVATVTALLRQIEGELPVTLEEPAAEPAPRIVTYEEMYGPITRLSEPDPPTHPVTPKPRKRWPW